jgi:hypothetical protein
MTAARVVVVSEPICLVCCRPLEHRDKWSGLIKGRYVCLRCALSATGFWQDDFVESWDREVGFSIVDGAAVPLDNPRRYHYRRSSGGTCSICGGDSAVLEVVSGRALCATCLHELDAALEEWRTLKP